MTPRLTLTALICLTATRAHAAPWEDATDATIGATAEWSNKVELADINGDGLVDILFANGAGYSSPDGPELSRAFLNNGPGMAFEEVGAEVFVYPGQTRVLKVRDVDGDGAADIFMGNSFGDASRLYIGDGAGGYTDASDKLPTVTPSVGDLELGDVDADGDLDVVLADWGPGNAGEEGGATQLWLGDGAGGFTDATATNMPAIKVSWSWELEFADVDNDFDLDILVSCKTCPGSFLFHNDGAGLFTDASDQLPQFDNNYEFEALDVNADGFLDLITINDGAMAREHILLGDGQGGFTDGTAELWPMAANVAGDDNMVAFLDYESDGDPDFLICGLFGNPDRLLVNDGTGHLELVDDVFAGDDSPGSLGVAVADLDGDKKIDVVFSEGEHPNNADRVFLGVDVAEDTAAPIVAAVDVSNEGELVVRARVHDNKTPVMPHDFTEVVVELIAADDGVTPEPLTWYGEALWRATFPEVPADVVAVQVCATDAAGNRACFGPVPLEGGGETTGDPESTGNPDTSGGPVTGADTTGDGEGTATPTGDGPTTGPTPTGGGDEDSETSDDASGSDTTPIDDEGGCGCATGRTPSTGWLLVGGALLALRRRRRV